MSIEQQQKAYDKEPKQTATQFEETNDKIKNVNLSGSPSLPVKFSIALDPTGSRQFRQFEELIRCIFSPHPMQPPVSCSVSTSHLLHLINQPYTMNSPG